jgi:ribosomal RNA-processing protein 9
MSSFFTVPNSQRKRKRDDRAAPPGSKKRGVDAKTDSGRRKEREDSISGSDLDDAAGIDSAESGDESGSDSEGETAADRRLKLAERYLDNIKGEVDEAGFDAADIDRDLIAERLKKDVDEFKGRTFRQIAAKLSIPTASHSFFRSDTQSTTNIAVHPPFVYTVSKDKTLTKWELATPTVPAAEETSGDNDTSKRPPRPQRKKPKRVSYARGMRKVSESTEEQGHTGSILSVAVSPSGKFVATGGADNKLVIWDAETLTPTRTFLQHRDSICSLAFARHISTMSSGEQLFSGSYDRTIKTWSISGAGHAYVETLFGHQDHVTGVAAMTIDECVSVGARDRTARLWKVVDETQLVFRGGASRSAPYHESNIDCIAPLPPNHFVTGSDSGSISLWSIHKKKPLYTVRQAHGLDPVPPLDVLSPELDEKTAAHNARHMRPTPRWITALTTLPGTDVVLSGSWDGWIRAWRISDDKKSIIPLGPIGAGRLGDVTPDTPSQQLNQTLALDATPELEQKEPEPLIKGVINDIAVFERRPESDLPGADAKSKEACKNEPRGVSIVAAVGKEHRLARWKCFDNTFYEGPTSGGRNGAVVFEVPFTTNDPVAAGV